jgi:hypothetical protein
MPTKRTPLKRDLRVRITPRTIDLFVQIEQILDAGLDDIWEDEGGRRREYLDKAFELHRLLGRDPCQTQVQWITGPAPPPFNREEIHDHEGAWLLRQALLAAAEKAE